MSTKQKIVIYNPWPELEGYIKDKLKPAVFTIKNSALTESILDKDAEIIAVFIDSFVKKDTIAKLPKLKLVATMGTGYDHIDIAAAQQNNVVVENVPTYGENTVAEHTFALILGLTRKLFRSVKRVKEGRYDFRGLRGTDLKDKTLGIVGTGHIGAHVARMALGFEMKIIAFDLHPNPALKKQLDIKYVSMDELLKKSDIVSLHTPLFKETYHLINKKNIKLMKPGSFLINTARGGLIDPQALVEGLNNETLAGAGLDVLEDENLLQDFEQVMRADETNEKLKTTLYNKMLISHPNVIVTPHNAFNSTEALQRIIDVTADNIKKFTAGVVQNAVGIKK